MAINRVQFQRGLSMAEFMERYGTEGKCHAALVASRWPTGFVCCECGSTRHSTFVREGLRYWQCSACREQTTVTCGHGLPGHQAAADELVPGHAPADAGQEQRVGLWNSNATWACATRPPG